MEACLYGIHTRVCGFYTVVEDPFMLLSSRHTQQPGLRCCRFADNEETLQGERERERDSDSFHHNLRLHKPHHWKSRQQVETIYTTKLTEFIFKISQQTRMNNKMKLELAVFFQGGSRMCCTICFMTKYMTFCSVYMTLTTFWDAVYCTFKLCHYF